MIFAGRITSITRENGDIIWYGYDDADRLISEAWKDSGGASIYAFAWDYDAVGNRTWESRDGVETYYEYNAANELTQSRKGAEAYTYYSYDSRGNCLRIQEPDGPTYFAYNYADLVTEIKFKSGITNYFYYDAQLRRYAMEDSSGLAYFTWDQNGMNLLVERDSDGNVTAEYIHGYTPIDGIGSCVAVKKTDGSTAYLYPVFDHRGSLMALVDVNGTVIARYEYDAWGNLLHEEVTGEGIRMGYQSNWLTLNDDPDKRFKLSPTRWYDAKTGRFGQRDPEEGHAGLYSYASENPVGRFDPEGLADDCRKSYNNLVKALNDMAKHRRRFESLSEDAIRAGKAAQAALERYQKAAKRAEQAKDKQLKRYLGEEAAKLADDFAAKVQEHTRILDQMGVQIHKRSAAAKRYFCWKRKFFECLNRQAVARTFKGTPVKDKCGYWECVAICALTNVAGSLVSRLTPSFGKSAMKFLAKTTTKKFVRRAALKSIPVLGTVMLAGAISEQISCLIGCKYNKGYKGFMPNWTPFL